MNKLNFISKKNGEVLDSREWNQLVSFINTLIDFYNEFPETVSSFDNDSGYLTLKDIAEYATKGDVASAIQTLINSGGITGPQGEPGLIPYIDNVTKHWMIGDVDTGIISEGKNGTNGITPHIDSVTGNWFIGNTDTGVHAQGPQGPAGQDGSSANQLQADWDQTDSTSADYIKNKPTIPTVPTNYVTTDTTQTISGTKTFSGGRNSFVFTGSNPIKMISPNSSTTGFTFFNSSEDEKGYMQYNQRQNALFLGKQHSDAKTGFLNEPGNVVEEIYIPTPGETGVWYIPIKITDGTTTVSAGSNGTVNMSSFGYAKVWKGTQTEYDAMTTHDSNTIYIIS